MYPSIETPSNSFETHQNQYQYHSNAFNILSTANTITSTAASVAVAPKTNGSVKPIIRPSMDAQTQPPSTIFNNNSNRNKFSCGAYNSTCSNNNFENVKHNIRTTVFNEKM